MTEAIDLVNAPGVPLTEDAGFALLVARLTLQKERLDEARIWLQKAMQLDPDLLKSNDVRALPDYTELLRLLAAEAGSTNSDIDFS